jgi:hypothetical protein
MFSFVCVHTDLALESYWLCRMSLEPVLVGFLVTVTKVPLRTTMERKIYCDSQIQRV